MLDEACLSCLLTIEVFLAGEDGEEVDKSILLSEGDGYQVRGPCMPLAHALVTGPGGPTSCWRAGQAAQLTVTPPACTLAEAAPCPQSRTVWHPDQLREP